MARDSFRLGIVLGVLCVAQVASAADVLERVVRRPERVVEPVVPRARPDGGILVPREPEREVVDRDELERLANTLHDRLTREVPSLLREGEDPLFLRGDANGDGATDMSDALALLGCKFAGRECSDCANTMDTNDDGDVDISDASYLLGYLFNGQAALPLPFPGCGADLTTSALGCRSYRYCHVSTADEIGGGKDWRGDQPQDAREWPSNGRYTAEIPKRKILKAVFDKPYKFLALPELVYVSNGQLRVRNYDGSGNHVISLETSHGEVFPKLHPWESRILFHDRQKGYYDTDIFTVEADGTGLTQLTHNHNLDESFPTWSPDGYWIAFSAWKPNEGSSIYLMHADGSNLFQLTAFGFNRCENLSWSPDGTRLACIGTTREADGKLGHEELFIVDVVSGYVKRITHTYGQDVRHFQTAWHPSGEALAFSRGFKPQGKPARYDLYMVLVNGMNVFPFSMQLTQHNARDHSPSFSKDGSHLVFMSDRQIAADDSDVVIDNHFNLFTMRINGTEWEQLTSNGGSNPDWR